MTKLTGFISKWSATKEISTSVWILELSILGRLPKIMMTLVLRGEWPLFCASLNINRLDRLSIVLVFITVLDLGMSILNLLKFSISWKLLPNLLKVKMYHFSVVVILTWCQTLQLWDSWLMSLLIFKQPGITNPSQFMILFFKSMNSLRKRTNLALLELT